MRLPLCLFSILLAFHPVNAQQNANPETVTTDCTFEDGRQISIRYAPGKGEEPRNGRLWEPGGAPMVLFAQAPLTLGSSSIIPGAYTVYTIPGKKEWTLIVNKNVTAGSNYDAGQDVARAPMETGEVDTAEKRLQASFAHVAPKDCSLRLYIGKVGAYAEFKER